MFLTVFIHSPLQTLCDHQRHTCTQAFTHKQLDTIGEKLTMFNYFGIKMDFALQNYASIGEILSQIVVSSMYMVLVTWRK